MENKTLTIEKERLIVIALKNCEKYYVFRNTKYFISHSLMFSSSCLWPKFDTISTEIKENELNVFELFLHFRSPVSFWLGWQKYSHVSVIKNIYNPVTECTPCFNVLCTAQLLFSEFVLSCKQKSSLSYKTNFLPLLVTCRSKVGGTFKHRSNF